MCSNDNISVLKFRNSKSYMFAILVSASCFRSVPLEKIIKTQYSFLYYLKNDQFLIIKKERYGTVYVTVYLHSIYLVYSIYIFNTCRY